MDLRKELEKLIETIDSVTAHYESLIDTSEKDEPGYYTGKADAYKQIRHVLLRILKEAV